jgi:membrane protein
VAGLTAINNHQRYLIFTSEQMRLLQFIINFFHLFKQAIIAWSDDSAASMGAALSYYTIFAMAPLLLIVMSVAGFVFGDEAAHGELFMQLRHLMGDEAAATLESLLAQLNKPEQNIGASVIGFILLMIGATSVFAELQNSLDRIWRVPALVKKNGLLSLLRERLLSFGIILGLAFLLMVSLVFGAILSALGNWWAPLFGQWDIILQVVNLVVGFTLSTTVFAMIYKLMPRASVHWRDVWVGALVTSTLFTIGKLLISFYIGQSGIASSFGAAGSIAVILVWVYYSAQIFFIGAEFTWVYAKKFGSMRTQQALAAKNV